MDVLNNCILESDDKISANNIQWKRKIVCSQQLHFRECDDKISANTIQ